MMTPSKVAAIATLVAVLASVVTLFVAGRLNTGPTEVAHKSAYDRVLSSGTLRCGYVPYPPGLIKDPNTGAISGVFAEAIQQAAANLGVKVEWTEEVGWGTMIEGLNADRYDMICSPVWANSSRAKVADFTGPLFYSGIDAFVKTTDERFNSSLQNVNSSSIKIATIDGEMSAIIASAQFPSAGKVSLPQMADDSQLLLNVAEGKADITFVEPYIAELFLKSHPGAVKNITAENPLRVFPNTMMLKKGETRLQSMMNVSLSELVNSGQIDALLKKYTGGATSFYPVALPYQSAPMRAAP